MRKTWRIEEKSSDQKDFKPGFEIQHTIVFTDDPVNFFSLRFALKLTYIN